METFPPLKYSSIWFDIFPFIAGGNNPPVEQLFVYIEFLATFFVSFLLFGILLRKRARHIKKILLIMLTSATTSLLVVFLINHKQIFSDYKELALRFRMRKATNEHLIRAVGKQEFEDNYSIDFYGSTWCETPARELDCYVSYEFAPGTQYGYGHEGSTYYISYDLRGGQTADKTLNDYGNYDWPNCKRNLGGCDFKLTVEDIRTIAKERGMLQPSYGHPLVMWDETIYVKVKDFYIYSPTRGITLLINPISGEVIDNTQ